MNVNPPLLLLLLLLLAASARALVLGEAERAFVLSHFESECAPNADWLCVDVDVTDASLALRCVAHPTDCTSTSAGSVVVGDRPCHLCTQDAWCEQGSLCTDEPSVCAPPDGAFEGACVCTVAGDCTTANGVCLLRGTAHELDDDDGGGACACRSGFAGDACAHCAQQTDTGDRTYMCCPANMFGRQWVLLAASADTVDQFLAGAYTDGRPCKLRDATRPAGPDDDDACDCDCAPRNATADTLQRVDDIDSAWIADMVIAGPLEANVNGASDDDDGTRAHGVVVFVVAVVVLACCFLACLYFLVPACGGVVRDRAPPPTPPPTPTTPPLSLSPLSRRRQTRSAVMAAAARRVVAPDHGRRSPARTQRD